VKSLGKVNDEGVEDKVDDTNDEDEGGYNGNTDDEDEDEDEDEGETDTAIVGKYVEEDELLNWFKAIKRNPVNIARKFILTVRASTQKREGFQMTITIGNQTKAFKDEEGNIIRVKEVQLLHDVKHRWDSLFMMLECMKELQLVSYCLLIAKYGQLNIDRQSNIIWKWTSVTWPYRLMIGMYWMVCGSFLRWAYSLFNLMSMFQPNFAGPSWGSTDYVRTYDTRFVWGYPIVRAFHNAVGKTGWRAS